MRSDYFWGHMSEEEKEEVSRNARTSGGGVGVIFAMLGIVALVVYLFSRFL